MLEFHRKAIALHKRYPVLVRGSFRFLYGSYNCLAYARFSRDIQIVAVFNNNGHEQELTIPVWSAGITNEQVLRQVFGTSVDGFSEESFIYPVYSGEVKIRLRPAAAVVLVSEKGVLEGAETIRDTAFESQERARMEAASAEEGMDVMAPKKEDTGRNGLFPEKGVADSERGKSKEQRSFEKRDVSGGKKPHWSSRFPWKKPPHKPDGEN